MNNLSEFKRYCLSENYPIMRDDVLEFLSNQIKSQHHVLEIGTCVGYSSIYLSSQTGCMITSLERDLERHLLAKELVLQFNQSHRIHLIYDDALSYETTQQFDVIIFDAGKAQNQAFLDRFLPCLKTKGSIFVDNVDFHGYKEKLDELNHRRNLRSMVRKLAAFEENLSRREDVKSSYLPLGDGLIHIVKL